MASRDKANNRDELIHKVRALLAKAEASEFEPERNLFQAKAQALITRHHIEQAELADVGDIAEHTIEIDGWGNATRGVVHLYSGVADLNRCSVGHRTSRGKALLVLYGTDADAELTKTLVDHLLPQLRHDILNDRPRSRMSYSVGWASEVVTRLQQAREAEAAVSNALVPTNVVADQALRSAHKVRAGRSTQVDVNEYGEGANAAENADIGRIKVGGGGGEE